MKYSKEQLRKRLINDYSIELQDARNEKLKGLSAINSVAYPNLAAGRTEVPIDEVIKHWEDGLTALKNGADPELYDF